jgi:tetratricopeptide (TPR) repeat protein
VGRAKEIVDVVKAFDERHSRRVCIYGSGGLGKTELAKAVARWYTERERVDAVLWASASSVEGEYKLRDLASLLAIAARVFHLPITDQSMFEVQKTVVREFLAAQRALVLLDNWEAIDPQLRREVWNFALSLPDTVSVLVTSRDVLPPRDARNLELDTLLPQDAADLFLKTARNAGYFDRDPHLRDEEIAILHSVCERLNGYPLAIEVVAGQTLSRTLDGIWVDLQRVPLSVLEGKDELTGEARGVWTTLDLSYDVLPPNERRLFERMCVFLSPASLEDIAAITETINPGPVLDMLVKRSLIRMREGAYSLLPIVRAYAEAKLADTGQDQRALHARASTRYGRKNTLEGALDSTDHLFELASRFEVRKAAEVFIRYVEGFYQSLVTHGYWTRARSKAEQLSVLARSLKLKQKEAQAISELGAGFLKIGDYERAAQLTRKAQKLYEESRDNRGVAAALQQLGVLSQLQGDYREATTLFRRSLNINQESGNKIDIATTLYELGKLARVQGDYDEATRLYRESLAIKKLLGDKDGIAFALNELGMVARHQGEFVEAARLYRESMEIKKELGDKSGISNTLHELGNLAAAQADYSEATQLYRQAFKIGEELGDTRLISRGLNQLGLLAMLQGNYNEATRLYRQSLKIKEELCDKEGIANTLHGLGRLAETQGDYGAAERLHWQGFEIQKELGNRRGLAFALVQLGQVCNTQGNMKEALNCLLKALAIYEELHSPDRQLVLEAIVDIHAEVGRTHFAEWLGELLTDAERINELLKQQVKIGATNYTGATSYTIVHKW